MRPGKILARLVTLAIATAACLILALLAPGYLRRQGDEPFSGASVMASARDVQVITQVTRLSHAPDLVLNRGVLYADGNATLGTPISRFVLDAPVFTLNVSGAAAASAPASHSPELLKGEATQLIEQLATLGYDALTVRRGTLQIVSSEGLQEAVTDIEAEVGGRRKGLVSARGSMTYRGQRLKWEGSLAAPAERKAMQRLPFKMALKSAFIDANFDGLLDVGQDLQLAGIADVTIPSLRRVARWFAVPVSSAEGLNATSLKGQFTWARHSLSFEQAKVSVDNNEATGSVTLNLSAERPLVDGTLAFTAVDLLPYYDSLKPQAFGFERPLTTWSDLDLTFPLVRYVDTDLRISTPKVTFKGFELGRTAATLTVKAGRLLCDVAEAELGSGIASMQLTADTSELVPRYTIKGRVQNLDAAQTAAGLLLGATWTGKGTLSFDVAGLGQAPGEVLRSLAGKAQLALGPSARVPVDAKALRGVVKEGPVTGWAGISKGQTQFDALDVRFVIANGIATAETLQARAGASAFALSGRINLPEANLDLIVAARSATPLDRPLKPSDFLGADVVRLTGPMTAPTLSAGDRDMEPVQGPVVIEQRPNAPQ